MDRDFIKNTTMELKFRDKVYKKITLVEMPFFKHKSEFSENGIKRHMTIRSDNRFALKFKEDFDTDQDFGEELTIDQIDKEGNVLRRLTLSNPRFDDYIEESRIYLIDCEKWSEECFDPFLDQLQDDDINSLLK